MADLGVPTEKGNVHQDSVLSAQGAAFLVADGMGGGAAGEVASEIVVETMATELERIKTQGLPGKDKEVGELLKRLILAAHGHIINVAERDINLMGMGTTATIALLHQEKVYVAWSGDSRLYRFNSAGITSDKSYNRHYLEIVTPEHSLVWQMVEKGKLSVEAARHHEQSHIITQNLGYADDPPKPDMLVCGVQQGDRFVLCSDGLNSMVPDSEIEDVLLQIVDTEQAMETLVAKANQAGGHDNITVILIDILEAPSVPVKRTSLAGADAGSTLVTSFHPIADDGVDQGAGISPVPVKAAGSTEPTVMTTPTNISSSPNQKKRWPGFLLIALIFLAVAAFFWWPENNPNNTENKIRKVRLEARLSELELGLNAVEVINSDKLRDSLKAIKERINTPNWSAYLTDSVAIDRLQLGIESAMGNSSQPERTSSSSVPQRPASPNSRPTTSSKQREGSNEPTIVPMATSREERPEAQPEPEEDTTSDNGVDDPENGASSIVPETNDFSRKLLTEAEYQAMLSKLTAIQKMANKTVEVIEQKLDAINALSKTQQSSPGITALLKKLKNIQSDLQKDKVRLQELNDQDEKTKSRSENVDRIGGKIRELNAEIENTLIPTPEQ
jgi:protein phosphatase